MTWLEFGCCTQSKFLAYDRFNPGRKGERWFPTAPKAFQPPTAFRRLEPFKRSANFVLPQPPFFQAQKLSARRELPWLRSNHRNKLEFPGLGIIAFPEARAGLRAVYGGLNYLDGEAVSMMSLLVRPEMDASPARRVRQYFSATFCP